MKITKISKGTTWKTDEVDPLIINNGYIFARTASPRGLIAKMRNTLGPLKGYCYIRCLQVAAVMSDKVWYVEGYADGIPHAWLSPKFVDGKISDAPWAIDPTWLWKHKGYRSGKIPLDNIHYHGVRFDGKKVFNWIKEKSHIAPISPSIFKSIGQWSLKELQ